MSWNLSNPIKIGARQSPLSQKQVKEILYKLHETHPSIQFEEILIETSGDQDLKTSLRGLDKTNFFTREIDELVLSGTCRIGIHSAKDLPDPIPNGLSIIAITKGLNPSDSLVFRDGESLQSLPTGAIIATSSERREEMVRLLRSDLTFIDLRGTIHDRLKKLNSGEADGVVVAEAALIRLDLTHLNRMQLPGETALLQGKLAVIARSDDLEMTQLFSSIDFR